MPKLANKVLLIGWDAADWKVINPLLDAGRMPALESLVNKGVMGNLATLDPPMSPMLWTSIGTGKHADKHGILNFTEPAPGNRGIRPVSSSSRKVKAVWNILTQEQLKTHVVAWWPSHPAEPVNGISVSNFYQRAHAPINKPWPLRPGTVHPASLAPVFDRLRIHPSELTEAHILPFVPDAAKVDQDKDRRLEKIARIIADASSVHSAATWIMEHEEWDFMAVYFDAIDHFSHGFMNFHPPYLKGMPKDKFELYKDVVTGGYLFHDMMLSRLLELAGEDTTVILVSDHGFHSDHLRPRVIPKEPAGPAVQHRGYGIFCMKGPHVRKDERIYGARLLDVTPTILTLFGLPVGGDMDGRALVQAFDRPVVPEVIPSWEAVPGECGMLPPEVQSDPYAEQEAMEQLVALGYIDKPGDDARKAVKRTTDESNFFLARAYINKSRHRQAVTILEKLFRENPAAVRYGLHLAKCYQSIGDLAGCRNTVEAVIALREKAREDAGKEQNGNTEAGKGGKRKIRAELRRHDAQINLLEGSLLLAEGRYTRALDILQKAAKAAPRNPALHLQIGKTFLKTGIIKEAARAFKRVLRIDPDNWQAHSGLAIVHLRLRNNETAADYALNAIGLLYHYPQAHYHLGMAMYRMGSYEQAAEALRVSAAMAPGMKYPHRLLALLYRKKLNDPDKAAAHLKRYRQLRRAAKKKTGTV